MTAIQDHTQFFDRIPIHGLTSKDGQPHPITLGRCISFPPPVKWQSSKSDTKPDIDLSPRSLDTTLDLTAYVQYDSEQAKKMVRNPDHKNSIGYGRAGLVFPLKVTSIEPSSDPRAAQVMDQLPPLCVKVARPGYARSLAREAWVYEYIDWHGLTGIIAPRCYGVFYGEVGTSTPDEDSDELRVDISGYDYYSDDYYSAAEESVDSSESTLSDGAHTASVYEEIDGYDPATGVFCSPDDYVDDPKGSYKKSLWRLFKETPETTTLTVLVMDLLGERMTSKGFEKHWDGDIQSLYDHLGPLALMHGDERYGNLLRVPPHARKHCPTHECAHKWNFVDWENASVQVDIPSDRIARTQSRSFRDFVVSVGGSRHLLRSKGKGLN